MDTECNQTLTKLTSCDAPLVADLVITYMGFLVLNWPSVLGSITASRAFIGVP